MRGQKCNIQNEGVDALFLEGQQIYQDLLGDRSQCQVQLRRGVHSVKHGSGIGSFATPSRPATRTLRGHSQDIVWTLQRDTR